MSVILHKLNLNLCENHSEGCFLITYVDKQVLKS